MSQRRSLDPAEQALWDRVVQTVKPLPDRKQPVAAPAAPSTKKTEKKPQARPKVAAAPRRCAAADKSPAPSGNLDSHWERRFKKAAVTPDVTVDLHGAALSGAYARLDAALEQAIHQNMRVILLITGKPRRHDRMSGQGRGAIAAIVHDWLAASRHAAHILSVRTAHPRHGGAGALYIILKR